MKDYYKILGVNRSSGADEIKKSYRKLAREFHPDKNQGDLKKGEIFREINEAYEILGNEEKRKAYDGKKSEDSSNKHSQKNPENTSGFKPGFDMNDFEKRFESFFGFNKGGEKLVKENTGSKLNTDAMFNSFFKVKK